jgi:choline dehydrogenase-like flavoprotein
VRFDAQALRLEWSPAERRVIAVVCRDPRTGSEDRIPCRAVVLAAGAVNSAQILMESTSVDFPDGLGNAHGVLGRYLHDHPLAKIVIDLGRRVPVSPASYITRPVLDRATPLYAAAYMQWNSTMDYARTVLSGRPGYSDRLGFSVFGTMAPIPENFVALDRSRPAKGRSPLLFALRHPPEAIALLEQARDDLMGMLERAGWEPRLSVFRVERPGNSVHYGGTCRMHASPRLGVVDGSSRVHGVPNVVVADSGVFTTGPEKNPVLTAMTLAARASDRLADELRSGDL